MVRNWCGCDRMGRGRGEERTRMERNFEADYRQGDDRV